MAAGLGFKTFNTGDVLSAADVNGYLMQGILVFADATARDAAITSPEEGQFAFLKDTNVTTYYTGSAWANVDTTGMTNPMTTTGDVIYSSSGSTPARLGIGTAGQVLQVNSGATAPEWATPASSTPTFVGCMLRKTDSTQAVATSTYVVVTFDNEIIDTDGFHSDVTNNERITIPTGKGGKYLVTGALHYQADAANTRRVLLTKNGAVGVGTALADQRTGGFSGAPTEAVFSIIVDLSAGDYIQLAAFQDSGISRNIIGFPSAFCYFSATYLGA
jgi:hypothetical protein